MPRIYKPGSFLRIPLADGSFGYGRVLKLPHDAYYDYRTDTPDSDLDTPVLGARTVRAQHPHTRPERRKRSPRPLGHASTRQALRELREQYRAFVAAFREAAARWMRGDFSASLPLFSFPPRVVPARPTRIL